MFDDIDNIDGRSYIEPIPSHLFTGEPDIEHYPSTCHHSIYIINTNDIDERSNAHSQSSCNYTPRHISETQDSSTSNYNQPQPRTVPQQQPTSEITGNHMCYDTMNGRIELKGPVAAAAGIIMAIGGIVSVREGSRVRAAEREAAEARKAQNGAEQREKEAEKRKEMAEQQRAEAEKREKEAAEAAEAELQRREKAEELLKLGIEVDYEVTMDEKLAARKQVGYVDSCINVAVTGFQNAGKSTLVNRLRGKDHWDVDAAQTGEAETTTEAKAYCDLKHPNFVWHDIPGGGVANVKAWGYYYNQKLFAYDMILIVHEATLTNLDLRILQVCKHFNQKAVVARTKADMHILNCANRMQGMTLESAAEHYIRQVRQDNTDKNMEAGKVKDLSPDFTDHIVSEYGIALLVTGVMPMAGKDYKLVDEREFLKELGILETKR